MKRTGLLRAAALVVATAAVTAVPALQASAATAAGAGAAATAAPAVTGGSDAGVSSTIASSWQTNDTVWALAYSSGTVYVGGQFTSVRPPGDPAGTGEVPRTFLAGFSSTTGALVTSFNPVITGSASAQVSALAVSNGILYIGGSFTHVNGVYRDNLAAINLSTGNLTSWAPTAFGKVNSIAPSPDGSEIYLGGAFNQVDGVARTYAGAVTASGTGTIEPWAPALNDVVTSVAVAPDDSRVIVGGYFTTINGLNDNAIGSTDPATGGAEPWAANIVPNTGSCSSSIKDVIIGSATASNPAGVVYASAEGTGGGCFDGDFAANTSDGSLVWQNACLGATQALAIVNGVLFKGSHAHDCAYSPGGFPQTNNASGTTYISRHLLDQSLTDGTLLHWTPDTTSATNGLGPRVFATDGSQLFVGGDFINVNGAGQQGFAIFPSGTDPQYPTRPSVAPTVTSTSTGIDTVAFPAVASRDVGTLTYRLYRDGGTTPIATMTATSWVWALPMLQYQDTGLTPGSAHTYTYTASDGPHTTAKSPASAAVTVASSSPTQTYQQSVLSDSPSFLWPLNETSGSTATDASSNHFNGIYEGGTTQGAAGPISGANATAFNGSSGNVAASSTVNNPQTFSIEAWFKTSANTGGKIVGFGNRQTGASSNYDRHIYMMNDGQLTFGVYNSQVSAIQSPGVYNDGQWHYLVATLSSAGMKLYVDNQLVASNSSVTSAQNYSGYWRVGGDNLNGGWNLDPWGSVSQGTTQPYSYYFNGSIADVAVYPTALSAAQIGAHYAAALQQNN